MQDELVAFQKPGGEGFEGVSRRMKGLEREERVEERGKELGRGVMCVNVMIFDYCLFKNVSIIL